MSDQAKRDLRPATPGPVVSSQSDGPPSGQPASGAGTVPGMHVSRPHGAAEAGGFPASHLPPGSYVPAGSLPVAFDGAPLRIDPAHGAQPAVADPGSRSADDDVSTAPAEIEGDSGSWESRATAERAAADDLRERFRLAAAPGEASTRREEEFLLEAEQITELLRSRFAEIDRREQNLNEQLVLLDQEQRNSRLWMHQCETEIRERQNQLQLKESALVRRTSEYERLASQLNEQKQALLDAQEDLAGERATMADVLSRQLDAERIELAQSRRAVDDLKRQLDVERARLRETLEAELDAERCELEREKKEWTAFRDGQTEALTHERAIQEEAVRRTQHELTAMRTREINEIETLQAQALERLAQERATSEAVLKAQREDLEQEIGRRQSEWNTRRESERVQTEVEREAAAQALKRAQADLDSLLQKQAQELETRRKEHTQKLEHERHKFAQECEAEREKLKSEWGLLENRIRFQKEHLQKIREDLEKAQRESRSEQQHLRRDIRQQSDLLELRMVQLECFRALLDEREASLARESQLLSEALRNQEEEHQRDRARLQAEREAWERERIAQQSELRRQQDMLSLHAENLEGRRTRLDQLRGELEKTHNETLEMRVAVEEAFAQFSQAAGAQQATQRLELARQAFKRHEQEMRESIVRQQQQLADAQRMLEQQKDAFRKEKQHLADLIAERDKQLREWESQLGGESHAVEEREAAWRAMRNRWIQEKVQAEHIIRDLLDQLSAANGTSANSMSAANRVDHVGAPRFDADAPPNVRPIGR